MSAIYQKNRKTYFFVGTVKREINDEELLLTPLHPLNMAYQLHLYSIDTSVISEEDDELLLKFQQLYLLPIISQNPITKGRCTMIPLNRSIQRSGKFM